MIVDVECLAENKISLIINRNEMALLGIAIRVEGFNMTKSVPDPHGVQGTPQRKCILSLAIVAMLGGGVPEALSQSINTGNPDLKVRWDNTFKYTAAWRVNKPDNYVASGESGEQPNTDYGDLAHDRGLINNRLDLLSEFDLLYKNYGFRISGAAWYDDHYMNEYNDYPDGNPPNTQATLAGEKNNRNSSDVQDVMGRRVEILDAFLYGRFMTGEESGITVRVGKHTQLYGETLFLGANGIAAAQGPVDLIKAYSLPNAQFKEIAMPVGQVSTDFQLSPDVSVGAYYQYEWKPIRLPAAGSYFGAADFVGDGSDLLLIPFGSGVAPRVSDLEGDDSGNFGARIKIRISDTDYGVYAARYSEKAPIPVVDVATETYRLMYARDIDTFGASISTVFGESNVAGEISIRHNTPLAPLGDLIISTMADADNKDNTPYARGNTFHMNWSAISVFTESSLWDGASFVGEIAYNRLMSVTHDPVSATGLAAKNTTSTRGHSAVRFVFQPEYFQVLPGVDMQVPIGVGYGISGRSAIFQMVPEHGGDISVGINADIQRIWKLSFNYKHFFGDDGPAPVLASEDAAASSYASYDQYYGDRDFVALTVQRSF